MKKRTEATQRTRFVSNFRDNGRPCPILSLPYPFPSHLFPAYLFLSFPTSVSHIHFAYVTEPWRTAKWELSAEQSVGIYAYMHLCVYVRKVICRQDVNDM